MCPALSIVPEKRLKSWMPVSPAFWRHNGRLLPPAPLDTGPAFPQPYHLPPTSQRRKWGKKSPARCAESGIRVSM